MEKVKIGLETLTFRPLESSKIIPCSSFEGVGDIECVQTTGQGTSALISNYKALEISCTLNLFMSHTIKLHHKSGLLFLVHLQ